MYDKSITLFCFNKEQGKWYPYVLNDVDFGANKGVNTSATGDTDSDRIIVLVKSDKRKKIITESEIISYLPPKEYQKTLKPQKHFTFTPGKDFICDGIYEDLSAVTDDEYESGFYHYMNKIRDGVYLITSADFFSLLPHFELEAK